VIAQTVPAPVRRGAALRWAAVVLVALLAGGSAMAVLGSTERRVGPVDVRLALVPSWHGGTQVEVPPLGDLTLDTHSGPVRLRATVTGIRIDDVQALLSGGSTRAQVADQIATDLRSGIQALVLRSALVALVAAAAAAGLLFRGWRAALAGFGATAVVLAGSGAAAAATARPEALTEPTYTGLLSQAPSLAGNLTDIGGRFDSYRARVATLAGSVSQLYATLSGLPEDLGGETDDIRVLWVSDVHNNPEAYSIMRTLVGQFDVQAVVDTGDSGDFGTAAEASLLDPIATMGVPYLWIRGNHDSEATTQATLESFPNVTVLDDGEVAEVAGLRWAGTGDPTYSPSSLVKVVGSRDALSAAGELVADAVRASDEAGEPVDVALVHEPKMAGPLFGVVPLVLDGHVHERGHRVEAGTLELTQGSSGGAGLRTLVDDSPLPLQMSVLRFDPDDGSLLAVDDITVGGVGQRSATVERRTAASYLAEAEPEEAVDPGTLTPWGGRVVGLAAG